MIIACRLCNQLIEGSLLHTAGNTAAAAAVPIIDGQPQMDRAALDYQAAIIALIQHVAQFHPVYTQVLGNTANTYYMHLVAKLAISNDEEFEPQREAARALVYWTLAGKMGIEDKGPVLSPSNTIPRQ
jgi:hypothetical protein